ncbi:hypothetical protein [Viridibacillus soli]|nr:hypothetical protein [Viridibacillus soli]
MKNWADELLVEYKEGKKASHQMKANLHEDNFWMRRKSTAWSRA